MDESAGVFVRANYAEGRGTSSRLNSFEKTGVFHRNATEPLLLSSLRRMYAKAKRRLRANFPAPVILSLSRRREYFQGQGLRELEHFEENIPIYESEDKEASGYLAEDWSCR